MGCRGIYGFLSLAEKTLNMFWEQASRCISRTRHEIMHGVKVDIPQPYSGAPGREGFNLTFFGDAGVVGRAVILLRTFSSPQASFGLRVIKSLSRTGFCRYSGPSSRGILTMATTGLKKGCSDVVGMSDRLLSSFVHTLGTTEGCELEGVGLERMARKEPADRHEVVAREGGKREGWSWHCTFADHSCPSRCPAFQRGPASSR